MENSTVETKASGNKGKRSEYDSAAKDDGCSGGHDDGDGDIARLYRGRVVARELGGTVRYKSLVAFLGDRSYIAFPSDSFHGHNEVEERLTTKGYSKTLE